MTMRIGARLTPWFRKESSFEEFAAFLKEAGLEAVDCPVLNPEIKEACTKNSLAVGSVDCSFSTLLNRDEKKSREGFEEAKELMDNIAEQGGSVLFTAVQPDDPSIGRAESFELWKKTWPDLVTHAEKKKLKIVMEPWPGVSPYYPVLGTTPEMLREMFKAIPSRSLGMCYDPSHFVRLRIDYLRVLDEFQDRVFHVHLKDTEIIEQGLYEYGILGPSFKSSPHKCGGGYWRYTLPGSGIVDWCKVVNRLKDAEYNGVLSIELEDHYFMGTEDLEKQGIIKTAHYIKQIRDGK